MILRDQNDLQISEGYAVLRDQNDLQIDLAGKRVVIISPTDGQTDFPQGGLYQWAFSGNEQVFRVEVATDAGFTNIVQEADVEAKELASTVSAATGYHIRISALQLINPSDTEITGVSLNTTVAEVQEGNTLTILGSVQGEGDYNTSGTWTRESGDAIPFTVSGNEITIAGDTETNSATFRFTSDQDNSFFVDRTVTVTAAPAVGINNSRAGDEESLRLHAEALGVADWHQNFGWSATSMSLDDPIYGVTVANIGGVLRVTEIDLMANNLVGELPEFPGLQECAKMRFKQLEANQSGDSAGVRITGRIPDSIGNNTKVTELSLSGRRDSTGEPLDIFQYADDDPGTGYNMKFGIAANQFTNGIPDSLYNLTLKKLEIDGQNSQFGATLKESCSNWNITHIYASGNDFYTTGSSAFVGNMPLGVQSWVNCRQFRFARNAGITSYEVNMFQGWNDLVRDITLGGDPTVSQPLPDLTGLTKVRFFKLDDIQWSGQYPKYINDFEEIQALNFVGHRFNDSRDLDFQLSPITQRFSLQLSTVEPNNLTGRLFTGSDKRRRMILFSVQANEELRDIIAEGVEKWFLLRFYRGGFTGGSTLPSKPPGMFGCSLRAILLHQARMQGQLTSDWKYAGSFENRGGLFASGTVTDYSPLRDQEEYFIEDSTANFEVNELVDMQLVNVNSTSGAKSRIILSNTATRIYYRHWVDDTGRGFDQIPTEYEVYRNNNFDNRAMDEGLRHDDNYLTGAVPTDIAPLHLVAGTFNLSLNLFQMKDIAPAVANIEKRSRMNWLILDPRDGDIPSASSGNITFSFNGNSVVITLDGADSGNVQAQKIADAITADEIELTCVFEEDGQALVFDTPLTGITNALKDITYVDTDSTGFGFEHTGYSFSYAPQGRLNDRRYDTPAGYTIPVFFQDDTRTIVSGNTATIDFSDQAYAGNVYTWKKKSVGSSIYSTISGETTDTLTISNFQSADQGDYILEITNPNAPDFTGEDVMRSGIITLTL